MGQWLSWIKSNEKELLTILDNLAKKAVETSEEVVILFSDLSDAEQAKKIHRLETEADVLTRDIFTELNKTFITPLDREDMQRIASKVDDVIDFMDGIAAQSLQLQNHNSSSILHGNGKRTCQCHKGSGIHDFQTATNQKSKRHD